MRRDFPRLELRGKLGRFRSALSTGLTSRRYCVSRPWALSMRTRWLRLFVGEKMLGSLPMFASLCAQWSRPPRAAGRRRSMNQSRLEMQTADLRRKRHLCRPGRRPREEQHQGR
jgi:hypothetical protein